MTLAEAVASGKPWKLPEWKNWWGPMKEGVDDSILIEAAIRADFIVKNELRGWHGCVYHFDRLAANCSKSDYHGAEAEFVFVQEVLP